AHIGPGPMLASSTMRRPVSGPMKDSFGDVWLYAAATLISSVLRDSLRNHLSQLALQNLSDRADRELAHDLQAFRQLERCDALCAQEGHEFIEAKRGTGFQYHAGARLFAEHRIRHRHEHDRFHGRMRKDQVLDLVATDLLATAIDLVLAAPFGVDVAAALAH